MMSDGSGKVYTKSELQANANGIYSFSISAGVGNTVESMFGYVYTVDWKLWHFEYHPDTDTFEWH